jgi:L-rhamnonate dehydratase
MKITNVRAVQPIAPESPPDWRTTLGQILVAVDTDAGLTGYGVGGGGKAGVHVVQTVLRDCLLDRDPEPVERLWAEMYAATLPFGRKGLAIMALSGVDLALWDLRGKAARQPVAGLLGGKSGEEIPVYITLWDDVTPEQAESFTAFKLHVGRNESAAAAKDVHDRVERIRTLIGPKKSLMIDAWMQWDQETTLAVAERCQSLGLAWIEEPLPADDYDGYAMLHELTPVPIAGGEHEFTAGGFREIIDRRLHTVLQPDVCWCGGMTEMVKIYEMAHNAGVRVCPHRGAELWGLHAIAALDEAPLAESGRPWMTWVGGQPAIEDGGIRLGDAPGFGVKIDEANLPL